VLVSAQKDGSTIRITVVTDAQGRYAFPAARLEPGAYKISIRAVGYELDGTGTAAVAANTVASADLRLEKTANLAAQLTNADWMASLPDAPQRSWRRGRRVSSESASFGPPCVAAVRESFPSLQRSERAHGHRRHGRGSTLCPGA
jgi:hypothetical protein